MLSKLLSAEDNGLSPIQRRQAQVIHEAGRDLRALIDDILDISRIESGQLNLHPEQVALRPMLEDLIELFSPQLADKPVKLSLRLEPGAPESLQTDRDKLRQILKNFLANAIKFTECGEIRVEVSRRADSERPLVLSVSDTGIGIPRDKQEIIFEAFQQADGSTRRRYGGTGLGLAISRELATLLGGVIEVESSPGIGSRFSLRLPLSLKEAAPAPESIQASSAEPLGPVEGGVGDVAASVESLLSESGAPWVLIIERDVKTLMQLTSELSRHGLRVQTAADLDEARETLREEGEGCALVLLDVHRSATTCEAIQTLLAEIQGVPPAIAVMGAPTGWLQPADCSTRATITRLDKPINAEALRVLLVQVLGETILEHRPSGSDEQDQTGGRVWASERT
ncbi:MAG: ATP-binding protein [Thermochromatium sp.]